MNSLVPTAAAPTRNGYVSVGAVYLSRGNRISDIRPDFAFALSLHRRPQIDQGGAKPERATHCMKFAPGLNQAARLGVRGSRRCCLQALVDRKNHPERIGPVCEDKHRAKEPTPIPGAKIDQYTEHTRDDHERGLHDQSTRVAGLPLHKQAARVESKTRRLLRDIDVDCRTGEKGDGDKCELLADDECRWHVRASIVQFQLIEL